MVKEKKRFKTLSLNHSLKPNPLPHFFQDDFKLWAKLQIFIDIYMRPPNSKLQSRTKVLGA